MSVESGPRRYFGATRCVGALQSDKLVNMKPTPIEKLVDKQAIYEVLLRYCRGIDRLDMALVRSCYHAGAIDHHPGFEGERDAYIAWVEPLLRRLVSTQHLLGNHLIELDGDRARSETYVTAYHLARPDSGPSVTTGLRYVDRFERRDGAWRIADRVVLREWMREERDQRSTNPSEGPAGARDRTDPVYRVSRRSP